MQEACAAGHVEAARVLITRGNADVQERSLTNGWVPLHEAAMRGNIDCCQLLLSFHASMHPRTIEGDTPRDLALRYGRQEIAEFMGKVKDASSHYLLNMTLIAPVIKSSFLTKIVLSLPAGIYFLSTWRSLRDLAIRMNVYI